MEDLHAENYKRFVICCLVTKLCLTLLQPHGLKPTRLLCPWDFPDKNTGVFKIFLQGNILNKEKQIFFFFWPGLGDVQLLGS